MEDSSPILANTRFHALIDTNVALDLFLKREPWLTEAAPMWEAREAGRVFVYLTASTLTDIFYICRKKVGVDRAKKVIETCLSGFVVLPVDRAVLEAALAFAGNDFEDNVQMMSAQSAGLDIIVTRDPEGYRHSPVPAHSPIQTSKRLNMQGPG